MCHEGARRDCATLHQSSSIFTKAAAAASRFEMKRMRDSDPRHVKRAMDRRCRPPSVTSAHGMWVGAAAVPCEQLGAFNNHSGKHSHSILPLTHRFLTPLTLLSSTRALLLTRTRFLRASTPATRTRLEIALIPATWPPRNTLHLHTPTPPSLVFATRAMSTAAAPTSSASPTTASSKGKAYPPAPPFTVPAINVPGGGDTYSLPSDGVSLAGLTFVVRG